MAKDSGNSFSDASNVGTLTGRRVFRDSLSSTDRFDFYNLRLTSRSALTGILDRLTDNSDLALFNSDRKRVAFSSKPDSQTESLTAVVDPGSYFVRVQRKSGSPRYRLALSTAAPPDEAGNTTATARAISLSATPVTFKDAVSATDTNDYYQFSTTAFSNVGLTLSGLSANANVQILNNAGTVIRSAVASGAVPESISAGLAAGNYFIRVFPGENGATTNYDLNLTSNPLNLVGLTNDNRLVAFRAGGAATATSTAITGLAANETLLGIDFRPATGQLFGLGSGSRLYSLDVATGAATQVGSAAFATALSGTSFGFDFNPVPDRIRVVSNTGQNLRLNPDTGAIAGVDTPLSPVGNIVASAYTNDRAGVAATTLLNIDSATDQLVRQGGVNGDPSPNGGVLTPVGALGVNFEPGAGFDIFTDGNGIDSGFAVSGSTLFGINLSTGAATSLGTVGSTPLNLIGLAVRA